MPAVLRHPTDTRTARGDTGRRPAACRWRATVESGGAVRDPLSVPSVMIGRMNEIDTAAPRTRRTWSDFAVSAALQGLVGVGRNDEFFADIERIGRCVGGSWAPKPDEGQVRLRAAGSWTELIGHPGALALCAAVPATRPERRDALTAVASSAGPSRTASKICVQDVAPISSTATNEYGQPGMNCEAVFARP